MADPIAYVSSWKIKGGQFDAYRRVNDELAKIVERNEPEVVAFLAFANDDGSEITTLHLFRDAATLERHMAVLAENVGLLPDDLSAVMQMLEPVRIEVLGEPPATAQQMDRGLAEQGVPFEAKRRMIGGFIRE